MYAPLEMGTELICVRMLSLDTRKDPQTELDGSQAAVARAIFEQSAIGMCIQSLDGRYLYVNKALCEITGRDESEMLSLRWVDVVDPVFVERTGD